MKKRIVIPFSFILFLSVMVVSHTPGAMAADLSNGTYMVDYEMLQAENDSVSIANDYFQKPATLTINNDEKYLQFTVNHAKWIQFIKSTSGEAFADVQVVSEDLDDDKRVVAFKIEGDLTAPLLMQMHVVIEEMEPSYDHKYSVRLNLDLETMEETDAPAVVVNPPVGESNSADTNELQDESTSNKALIYVLLAVIAIIAIIFVRKITLSRINGQ
ncbi:NEAT domain-containing protein [Sporosarcina sp. E16_8]|uniref:NEAT domain-containing protein n=1 Tax=Sporosarcina sp. E16_8 TaxID=2789295 RepID=UPI001A9257AD|nr:NEAT domain-containing protein [Sporosarcina sp. E16_8]MBO0588581.1 NEAT domain-containing protein [Sporosarcina sp. E16_8]